MHACFRPCTCIINILSLFSALVYVYGFCLYCSWKCHRPGHLAEDCLVNSCSQVCHQCSSCIKVHLFLLYNELFCFLSRSQWPVIDLVPFPGIFLDCIEGLEISVYFLSPCNCMFPVLVLFFV